MKKGLTMAQTTSSKASITKNARFVPAAHTPEPQLSLTERAYADLEELIVTLQLPPGSTVSEVGLSTRLGIGRTPIREALQRLARERLVVILPQRGIIVSEINVGSQLKVLELRRELERLTAKSAARRASEDELKRFREIARELKKASKTNDEITFMRLDREFNLLAAAAARNEFISSSMGLIHSLSRRFWYIHYKKVADMPLAARLHADVAMAIANRDEVAAEKASDALLDYLEEFTRATLDSGM
ncbi:MAG TPA: GntR family transcriptional regulator [Oxalobacteraceae bacterium]|jgi:DNA-binding GntR family transcriptional regulator|nr:GntR family transcriptional regulator [Oxalobacteraceae bacterium]HCN91148.1 GntR family transcriptional regulator [Oxalobacteraceae bacterium]